MGTIITNVRWADNTKELTANLKQGIDTIDAMQKSVDRTAKSLGGEGLFKAANQTAAAILQLGGVTRLTAAEQERATALIDKAIDKYATMGKTAPSAMIALRDSMKDASDETNGWLGILGSLGSSFVARVAEGVLLRDAVRGILSAVKDTAEAFPALIENTVAVGNSIFEMSMKTGASVEGLSALRYVASQTGVDFSSFGTMLSMMEKNLGAVGPQAKLVQEAVGRLGLDLVTLKNERPDEAFIAIAQALSEIPNNADKANIAAALLGRGAKEMAALWHEDIGQMIKEAQDLGLVMSTDTAAGAHLAEIGFQALHMQVEALGMQIANAFIPAVIGIENDLGIGLTNAVHTLNDGLNAMGGNGGFLSLVVTAMGKGSEAITAQVALYEYLKSGLIDVSRLGLEPLITAVGFTITEFEASKVVFGDVMQVIDGVRLSYLLTRQAMSLGLLPGTADLAAWKALDQQIGDLEVKMRQRGASLQKDVANEQDWSKWSVQANQAVETALTAVGNTHTDVAAKIKAMGDVSRAAYGGVGQDVDTVKGKVSEFDKALADVASLGSHWQDTLNQMDSGVVDFGLQLLKMGASLKTVQTYFQLTEGQAKALEDQFKFLGATVSYASDSFNAHGVGVGLLGARYSEFHSDITGVSDATGLLVSTVLPDATGKFIDLGDGIISGTKALQDFRAVSDLAEWDKGITLLSRDLKNLAQVSDGSFGGIIKDISQIVEAMKLGSDSVKEFEKSATSLGKAMGVIGMASTLASATQGGGAKGAIGGALTGAEMGAEIAGPLGAAIGASIGLIAGILRTDHTLENVARDSGQKFGTAFSKSTTDAIVANMQSGMSEAASELNNLGAIIADAGGITAKNVGLMTDRFHDLFVMLDSGQMTAAQVNKQLQDGFPALAAAATDATGRWSAGLKTIIALDQQAGLGTQAITDALKGQATTLATGFNAAAAALVDDKDSLAGLGAQAVTTYATMIASGSTAAEALAAVSPGLASIEQSYKDLGISVDDVGLKSLEMQADINKGNPTLIAGISGLASEFVALDNLGEMNTTQLSAMEVQGMSMYTRLQAGVAALGGDTKDALEPMQGFLHAAMIEAQNLGVPLDANTQMLVDQSKDAGIWQAALTPQDKLLAGMQSLVDKVGELVDRLNGIPSKIDTTVTTNFATNGAPPDLSQLNTNIPGEDAMRFAGAASTGGIITNALAVQRFIGGGIVAEPHTPLVGFGSDTALAAVTPGELLSNAGQQSYLANLMTAGVAMASDLVRAPSVSRTALPLPATGGDTFHAEFTIHALDAASVPKIVREQVHPALLEFWRQSGGARRQTQKMLEID